jgi:hypothetical protein
MQFIQWRTFAKPVVQPIGQIFGCIPRTSRTSSVLIQTLKDSRIVQSKQDSVKPVYDLLHELAHFVIADTRQLVPRYLAIRRHDLCVGKIANSMPA